MFKFLNIIRKYAREFKFLNFKYLNRKNMATIQKFEDMLAWQKSRELTKDIYKLFKDLKFKDYGLQDQIQRASVSIMSNIAEGFESGTRQEFLNYLYIAKASAGEVRAQLYIMLDAEYLNIETFKNLKFKAEECSKLIFHFIKKLKQSPYQGLQNRSREYERSQEAERWLKEQMAKHKTRENEANSNI